MRSCLDGLDGATDKTCGMSKLDNYRTKKRRRGISILIIGGGGCSSSSSSSSSSSTLLLLLLLLLLLFPTTCIFCPYCQPRSSILITK